jgi:glycosyltransferase involved in cell wall biosynthesis
MRVVIATMQVPFHEGGSERLVTALRRELHRHGHQAAVVQLPINWQNRAGLLKGYLAWRLLDLEAVEGERVDVVIATKFPSFQAQHPNKVVWLVQQFRQVYDLYGTEYSPYGHRAEDRSLQRIVHRADSQALAESRRLFAISANVARRLADHNRLHARVLYPPPELDGRFRHDAYGDYVLSVSRLNVLKRVDLLLHALAHARSDAGCIVVGSGPEERALRQLARRLGLDDRVRFLGYVREDELLSLYAGALAVYYAPYDEDYGFATVEAFKSQKPVLTASDSGGVLEFVTDGATGYVTPATEPQQLADCVDRLYADRRLCRRLGDAGRQRVQGITWDATIPQLLGS